MFKKTITISMLAVLMGCVQSCQKEEVEALGSPTIVNENTASVNRLQSTFAKALAKVLDADPQVRIFLKEEANKQFDKDYDVLYHLIKDQPISGGASLHDRLLSYTSLLELTTIERQLPLLTIFVPTLPSGFSASTWDTSSQVPMVAVSKQGNSAIPFYDATGQEELIPAGATPGFPILLIKQNERVTTQASAGNLMNSSQRTQSFLESETYSFRFADASFDGLNPAPQVAGRQVVVALDGREAGPTTDPINIGAFDSGSEWHRDFVYYGITPTIPQGEFKPNYRETIRSIKFSKEAYYKMSDQGNDPSFLSGFNSGGWTEGSFEIRITPVINSKNGLGSELVRLFPVRPNELFDISYTKLEIGTWPMIKRTYYILDDITPKEYRGDIEIVAWDLQNYGTAWKLLFHEEDTQETKTITNQVSTTYAANFEINGTAEFPKIFKIGAKFGGSASTTDTKTVSVVTTLGSDYLGEIGVLFNQPIVISKDVRAFQGTVFSIYNTFENGTGGINPYVSISMEPLKFY